MDDTKLGTRTWRRWQVIKVMLTNNFTSNSRALCFFVGGKVPITIIFAPIHQNDILRALGKEHLIGEEI